MTSDFYFTATSWFPGNVRVKPHSRHSAPLWFIVVPVFINENKLSLIQKFSKKSSEHLQRNLKKLRIAQKATKSKIIKRIGTFIPDYTIFNRVSVPGVKSLGVHFACLCRGFDFYEVKKLLLLFFKKKMEILLHF